MEAFGAVVSIAPQPPACSISAERPDDRTAIANAGAETTGSPKSADGNVKRHGASHANSRAPDAHSPIPASPTAIAAQKPGKKPGKKPGRDLADAIDVAAQELGKKPGGDLADAIDVAIPQRTAVPATPTRLSPRLQELNAAGPTLRQIQRIEQEELLKAASLVRRTRSVTATRRGVSVRVSPHVDEDADEDSEGEEQDEQSDDEEGDGMSDDSDADEEEAEDEDKDEDKDAEEQDMEEEDAQDEEEDDDASDSQSDGGTTASRSYQVCDHPVTMPPIQRYHVDWAAFEVWKAKYEKDTHQKIVVQYCTHAPKRNKAIDKLLKPQPHVPLDKGMFERVYVCTHGPKPKKKTKKKGKSESKSRRPFRFVNWTECPFRYRVQLVCVDGEWVLEAKVSCLWHNHLVGPAVYETYPVARGVKDPATKKRADEMVRDGARPDAVMDMLLVEGENVIKKDVENMYSVHSSRADRRDDNRATSGLLAKLLREDKKSAVTIDDTAVKETGVISITTGHMRDMFTRFGELIMVDCTHKTNLYDYQLCTVMVMDEYGCGQVVQHSLIETNSDWHMERVIAHLKRVNPDSYERVRLIMVDKDLNEIKVLKREFPEADVLICHFHVVKYLEGMQHKPEFGSLSQHDHTALKICVHDLVYSETVEAYEENKAALKAKCQRLGFMEYITYLERNWFNCPEMWSLHTRSKVPHLKNHTNNRLESWFGKFKKGVKRSYSMFETVTALLAEQRRILKAYRHNQRRQGRYYNANYDDEMASVLLCATPYVAKLIEPQYTTALNKVDQYAYDEDEQDELVIVKGVKHDSVVDLRDFSCGCLFAVNMLLPCRHAMAYRAHKKLGAVIPLTRIDVRWKRQLIRHTPVPQFIRNGASTTRVSRVALPDDGRARYNEALRLLQPICNELAGIEDKTEFNDCLDFLRSSFRNMRKRKRVELEEDEDEEMAAHVDLSQTNSLYSSQLGDVPPPTLEALRLPVVQELIVDTRIPGSDSKPGPDLVQTGENLVKESDESEGESTDGGPRINLNKKAPKTGRPKTDRQVVAAKDKEERMRHHSVEKARRTTNELTLCEVLDNIDRTQPHLATLARRLDPIVPMYTEHENKKPMFKVLTKPKLNQDVYYFLTPKLMKACVEVLPLATRPGEVIRVGTPDSTSSRVSPKDTARRRSPRGLHKQALKEGEVEVVVIKGLGMYSRSQIETMARAASIKHQLAQGLAFVSWIELKVAPIVPAALNDVCKKLAMEVRTLYPAAFVPGLPAFTDCQVSNLYQLEWPQWLNDGTITAFCERMSVVYPGVQHAGAFSAETGKEKIPDLNLRSRMRALAAEDGASHVLLPVNFGDDHWTCVIVDLKKKEIKSYDSITMDTRVKPLQAIATSLVKGPRAVFKDYAMSHMKKPVQADGHSCGVLVCLKFWQEVDPQVQATMTKTGLIRLRVELLHFILKGSQMATVAA